MLSHTLQLNRFFLKSFLLRWVFVQSPFSFHTIFKTPVITLFKTPEEARHRRPSISSRRRSFILVTAIKTIQCPCSSHTTLIQNIDRTLMMRFSASSLLIQGYSKEASFRD